MRRDERGVLPAADDADLATSDAYPPTLLRKPRLRIGRRIAATIAIIGIGIIGGAIAGTTVLLMMALVPARGNGVQVDFRELLFLP